MRRSARDAFPNTQGVEKLHASFDPGPLLDSRPPGV
jgi:hypothetical protein